MAIHHLERDDTPRNRLIAPGAGGQHAHPRRHLERVVSAGPRARSSHRSASGPVRAVPRHPEHFQSSDISAPGRGEAFLPEVRALRPGEVCSNRAGVRCVAPGHFPGRVGTVVVHRYPSHQYRVARGRVERERHADFDGRSERRRLERAERCGLPVTATGCAAGDGRQSGCASTGCLVADLGALCASHGYAHADPHTDQ